MDEKTLAALVKKAQKGDTEAFGDIYVELQNEAFRFAVYYLHNDSYAPDAVQEATYKAFVNLKQLKKPEAFRSWFFKILSNECKRILNEQNKVLPLDEERLADTPDEKEADPYLSAELWSVFYSLPEEDRLIVRLAVLEDFNSTEIAEITGIKASTVRSRLSRALHKMREQLERN